MGRKTGERGQLVELVGDQRPSPEAPPTCTRGRSNRVFRFSGEERWRKVGVSGSLMARSEEMTQSNTSYGEKKSVIKTRGSDGSGNPPG